MNNIAFIRSTLYESIKINPIKLNSEKPHHLARKMSFGEQIKLFEFKIPVKLDLK
jgi:hypothetical protein